MSGIPLLTPHMLKINHNYGLSIGTPFCIIKCDLPKVHIFLQVGEVDWELRVRGPFPESWADESKSLGGEGEVCDPLMIALAWKYIFALNARMHHE